MIKLTAQIVLIDGEGQELYSATCNIGGNNVSADISKVVASQKRSIAPFIIGATKIGENRTLESGLNYYIGSQVCGVDKVFNTPYEITLTGEDITHFTIVFDTLNGQFPNEITIDGDNYIVNAPIFNVSNLPLQNTHNITIRNWNTPFYPVTISGIYGGITIDVTYRNMQQLSAQHLSKANNETPSYGIISNVGELQFTDMYGEIKDYADMQMLKADLSVTMFLTDTQSHKQTIIGTYETDDWDYNTSNMEVTVQLKDSLEELQSIHHAGISLARSGTGVPIIQSALDMYNKLKKATPDKYNFLEASELDFDMSNITIPKFFLESGSLWQQWTKLCELTGTNIYQDFNGNTVMKRR